MSRWVDFVKEFAKRKGLSYGCALSDPDCSQEYRYKYKEGKLSADQRKAIKSKEPKEPRTRMSDFYEITGVVEEQENPMPNKTPSVKVKGKKLVKGSQEAKDRMSEIRALAKNAGRPKGSKNKVKKGKGILEDLAKRERGQITTEKLIEDRDKARIAELEAEIERLNAMVGNSPRPTVRGGRKKYDGRGILEELAKRERGQISTKKIIADRVNEVLRKAEIRQKNQEDREEGWRAVNAILPPPPRFTVEWRNTF